MGLLYYKTVTLVKKVFYVLIILVWITRLTSVTSWSIIICRTSRKGVSYTERRKSHILQGILIDCNNYDNIT